MEPLISVITVSYNASSTIERTIRSVIRQNKTLFEYIIIDGYSTDDTYDIIRKYSEDLEYYVSEYDNGIYDAMNKGIDKAKGEWLFFLGADDYLTDGIFENISKFLKSDLYVVYGNVLCNGTHEYISKVGFRCLFENRLHHQGAFYNKKLFENFRYDQKYPVSADYELTIRIYLNKLKHLYVPMLISYFATGGASSSLSSNEINLIRQKYIKSSFYNIAISYSINSYYFFFKLKSTISKKLRKCLKFKKVILQVL